MGDAFDHELNFANNTDMLLDDTDPTAFSEEDFGPRPASDARPYQINVNDLKKGGSVNPLETFAVQRPQGLVLNNRVPGIAEMLDADSEVIRNLGTNKKQPFSNVFDKERRHRKKMAANGLGDKADHNADQKMENALAAEHRRRYYEERMRKHEEREHARAQRHNEEMQQREQLHHLNMEAESNINSAVHKVHKSVVSRTNQLANMIQNSRNDALETHLETKKQLKSLKSQLDKQQKFIDHATIWFFALLAASLLFLICYTVLRFWLKPMWFKNLHRLNDVEQQKAGQSRGTDKELGSTSTSADEFSAKVEQTLQETAVPTTNTLSTDQTTAGSDSGTTANVTASQTPSVLVNDDDLAIQL